MVCEGPIWSLTAESCVYYRWNNLSNNGTTSEILGRCASVWLRSLSPSLSCSFNVFICSIYVYVRKCVFVCACKHAYHVFLLRSQRNIFDGNVLNQVLSLCVSVSASVHIYSVNSVLPIHLYMDRKTGMKALYG